MKKRYSYEIVLDLNTMKWVKIRHEIKPWSYYVKWAESNKDLTLTKRSSVIKNR